MSSGSPPASPTQRTSASNRSTNSGGVPALQRSATMSGLQSKASFISTLRTLPTQRQSIAPPSGVGLAMLDADESNGSNPFSSKGPLSTKGGLQSPLAPRSGVFPSTTEGGGGGAPMSLLQNSSSRIFGDETEEMLDRRQLTAASVSSGATPPITGASPDCIAHPTTPLVNHPHQLLPTNPHDDPIISAPPPTRDAHVHFKAGTWADVFIHYANLPEDVVEEYAASFHAHDMPPPTELTVLQHGVDHELLIALGVSSLGHRARIVSACRAIAASSTHMERHADHHHHHHHPSFIHHGGVNPRYRAPPREQAGGLDNSHRPHHPQQSMFPQIYRRDFEEEDTRRQFFADEGSEGSGIDDVGELVHSVDGSSEGLHDDREVDRGGERGSGVGSVKRVTLAEPLLPSRGSNNSGRVVIGKKGSLNARSSENNSSSSKSSDTSSSTSTSTSTVSSVESLAARALITDEHKVHKFVFCSVEQPHCPSYTWVDLVGRDPKRLAFRDHLSHLVKEFHFAEPLLLDIDLTLALPQMISCPNEPDQFLIILRVAAESSGGIEEDSLHLLTNRIMIAVHLGTNTIVSLHRRDSMAMAALRETWRGSYSDKPINALLCRILEDGLLSYVDAIHDSESLLDEYEALMLKHSVGATSSSSSGGVGGSGGGGNAAVRRPTTLAGGGGNSSFSSDEDAPWWSPKTICESLFGESNMRRGRAASSLHTPTTQTAIAHATQLRLRNKAYQVDMLDSGTFSRQRMNQLLYHLHRRCSVYNRMLTLTQTTLEVSYSTLQLANNDYAEQVGRSCGELAMKAESLHDNCQNLLNLHLSLVSFRTNELMNLLTVYSAIFIPITFICSVYGMNFVNMPELSWYNGYYYCLALMGAIVIAILTWFRRKGFI